MRAFLPPQPEPQGAFLEELAAARCGSQEAIERLFERSYPQVERMVHVSLSRDLRLQRPWLTSRFSTGDVVQEVFRSLLMDLKSFEGRTEWAFTHYLATVVRNRLFDAIRFHEAARRDGRRTQSTSERSDRPGAEPPPDAQAQSADELALFYRVLETFPERERYLLRGRLEHELPFTELTEQLGFRSVDAVRRCFYAAQAQLAIRMRKGAAEGADHFPRT